MNDRISAPNVYLYAFQLYNDSPGRDNFLWQQCDKIMEKVTYTYERLTPHLVFHTNYHSYSEDLLSNTPLRFSTRNPLIEGFVQPIRIQDCYGLCLNIGCREDGTADNIKVSFIKKFNPNQALLISGDDHFLGQTLIITAWLTEETLPDNLDSLKPLADKCRDSLFSGDSPPTFYRSGKLFGSPIFEYGSVSDIANYRHVLVWLLCDEKTDADFNNCQQEIFNLLFHRNKIIKAFQDTRQIYHELDSEFRTIEKNMDNLQQQFVQGTVLTASQLLELQEQLKQLFSKAVTYTRLLRKLEDFDNTIAINIYNYNEILQKICVIIESDKEELSILNRFSIKSAPYIRSQIAAGLGYFRHGTSLIEQAIASIRGIVEIEQARSDRENQIELRKSEQAEKKRDARLESTIQAIGVGLATGGIAASSGTDKLFETLKNHPATAPVTAVLHPFIFSFFLSCAIGIFAGAIVWCWTRRKK
ncbi:hypothetical protein NDI47_07035 [Microcoleus vaginatus GB1-A2]|uniref:hypothetical protein n=1 Tax=Microcoleus vaginatus TaxID=119532 RepID=UPI001689CFFC|nr:hypothetical protein [Microcoleus sp. FACHB-61]